MGIIKCCVPNCEDKHSHRHRFPNPRKDIVRFKKWVCVIGNNLLNTIDPETIFLNKRVCRRHFASQDVSAVSGRVRLTAVPRLHLPQECKQIVFEYSESDGVENSNNVQIGKLVDKIKQEPGDNLDNIHEIGQGTFELLTPVELKTEDDASSATELEVGGKVEVEEDANYENLLETPFKTEIIRTSSQKKGSQVLTTETTGTNKPQLFHCGFCDYATKLKNNLTRHTSAVHLKNKPYKCDICSFQCEQKFNLKRHKASHFKKCSICDYIGINQRALSMHRKANHSLYKCRFCDHVTKYKHSLEIHENTIHLKKEKYSCPDCNYKVLNKANMSRHKKMMHEDIYFNCDRCNYKTKILSRLKHHINAIHTRSKLVCCAHCDYTSTLKSSLVVHLRNNHAHFDAFQCEKCDFACKERSELIRHFKVEHRKNYQFECNDCGFLAKTKLKLEAHILRMHLKKSPFQCKFCTYGGFAKARIVEHAKAKHKEAFIGTKLIKDGFVSWKILSL